jgi:hypothetical protein
VDKMLSGGLEHRYGTTMNQNERYQMCQPTQRKQARSQRRVIDDDDEDDDDNKQDDENNNFDDEEESPEGCAEENEVGWNRWNLGHQNDGSATEEDTERDE